MIKLNLLVAYRNLLRNKFYTFINIFGLALSLATCLLIAIFIKDETSYDKHWSNSDRIYRIAADMYFNDTEINLALSPAPMADAFREEFPELQGIGRMRDIGSSMVKIDDHFLPVERVAFSDPEILDIFTFDFISGTRDRLLENATDVMISRTVSEQLFGTTNSIGKTFELDNSTFEVKAVYNDLQANTHFHYDLIISMERLDDAKNQIWLSNNYRTYLLLDEANDQIAFEKKIPLALRKYVGPQLEQVLGATMEQFEQGGGRISYYLQPVQSIHLDSHLQYEIEANGDMTFVYIFITAGIFILIIAVINFMNISTARSSMRAKEVGLRKVIGSKRGLLIGQFMTESMLNTLLSMILAILLMYIFLPLFNTFTGKEVSNPLFGSYFLFDEVAIATIVVGVLSGLYPAFYLSGFKPIKVLKGNLSLGLGGKNLRNILVVLQFSASVILIFGSVVIYSQLNYTMKKELGFTKDQSVVISDTHYLGSKVDAFKEELVQNAIITNASMTSFLPIKGNRSDSPLMPKAMTNTDGAVSMQNWVVDDHYIPTLGMKLKSGRNFDEQLQSDSLSIIINEAAAARFGFENPIGEKLKTISEFTLHGGRSEFTIIGVVEDFHFDNFKTTISPLSLVRGRSTNSITVRFNAENTDEVIQLIENKWDTFSPNVPLSYVFMDQQFEAEYESEQKLGSLFNTFAGLAVFIACLGLFGLAAFTADQKKKELGIRKVLGASTKNLMFLQLKGYTRLLIIAVALSLPAAFYITTIWLEGFAYRTSLNGFMFMIPTLAVLFLAWGTVSSISYSASRRNPVDNLKYE